MSQHDEERHTGITYDLDKRLSMQEQRFESLEKKVDGIGSNISRLIWMVIGAVVVAMLNMVINSGGSPL